MRRRVLLTLLLLLLRSKLICSRKRSPDADHRPGQAETRDRVLLYLNDTPIYQEDPYFEVAVRSDGWMWVAERDPEHNWEALPMDWKPGVAVEGRIEKHSLYLRRPNGTYLRFIITSRRKAPAE